MKATVDRTFDGFNSDGKSFVYEIESDVHGDGRGSFSEVLKSMGEWYEGCGYPLWLSNMDWIRQINRSKSVESVVRGCHAQRGVFCQGKLVEAVNNFIFDIITDARPDSSTFGVSKVYRLDGESQRKLWVPRGFLHSFVTPDSIDGKEAVFMYYVDNVYNRESEICVNPMTLLPDVVDGIRELSKENESLRIEFSELVKAFSVKETLNFSEKDKRGLTREDFFDMITSEYEKTGKTWYR